MSAASPEKRPAEEVADAPDAKKAKADEPAGEVDQSFDEENIDKEELSELKEENIIVGRRTRGKKIDWAKANAEYEGPEGEEEDDAAAAPPAEGDEEAESSSSEEEEEAEAATEEKTEDK